MSKNPYCIVLCTCPDIDIATNLANQLVSSKLAACVNILPKMISVYTWKDNVETASEVLLVIKTLSKAYASLEHYLTEAHPYECPEIIALPIEQGLTGYLQWINNTVTSTP